MIFIFRSSIIFTFYFQSSIIFSFFISVLYYFKFIFGPQPLPYHRRYSRLPIRPPPAAALPRLFTNPIETTTTENQLQQPSATTKTTCRKDHPMFHFSLKIKNFKNQNQINLNYLRLHLFSSWTAKRNLRRLRLRTSATAGSWRS